MSHVAHRPRLHQVSRIVIPARFASTRLPQKLLLRETGKSLIQHTYEAACLARRPLSVCVATDHEQILNEVQSFGGEVCMTDPELASGTDRVAAVARQMTDTDIVVNVQGDEPELSGESIDLVIEILERDPAAVMSTLATPIRSREQLEDPACVKVAFDAHGRALYFSRSPIPHARQWDDELLHADPASFHQHIGMYAYRTGFLLQLAKMPRSRLEKIENLEQLRVLEAGFQIVVGQVNEPTRGIDTPADYQGFVERWRSR